MVKKYVSKTVDIALKTAENATYKASSYLGRLLGVYSAGGVLFGNGETLPEKMEDGVQGVLNMPESFQRYIDTWKMRHEIMEGFDQINAYAPSPEEFREGLRITREGLGESQKDLDNLELIVEAFKNGQKIPVKPTHDLVHKVNEYGMDLTERVEDVRTSETLDQTLTYTPGEMANQVANFESIVSEYYGSIYYAIDNLASNELMTTLGIGAAYFTAGIIAGKAPRALTNVARLTINTARRIPTAVMNTRQLAMLMYESSRAKKANS